MPAGRSPTPSRQPTPVPITLSEPRSATPFRGSSRVVAGPAVGNGGASLHRGSFVRRTSATRRYISFPGTSVTYTVECDVDLAATGTIENTATITPPAGVFDLDTDDQTATDIDAIVIQAEVGAAYELRPAGVCDRGRGDEVLGHRGQLRSRRGHRRRLDRQLPGQAHQLQLGVHHTGERRDLRCGKPQRESRRYDRSSQRQLGHLPSRLHRGFERDGRHRQYGHGHPSGGSLRIRTRSTMSQP